MGPPQGAARLRRALAPPSVYPLKVAQVKASGRLFFLFRRSAGRRLRFFAKTFRYCTVLTATSGPPGGAVRCGRAITLLPASFLLCSLQALLTGRLHGLQTANRPLCTGPSRRSRGGRGGRGDRNDRGVGLSPGARNTIRDSRLDVKSCRRHATLTGGWIARCDALICTTDE